MFPGIKIMQFFRVVLAVRNRFHQSLAVGREMQTTHYPWRRWSPTGLSASGGLARLRRGL